MAHHVGILTESFGLKWADLLSDLLQNLMADADLRVKCAAVRGLRRIHTRAHFHGQYTSSRNMHSYTRKRMHARDISRKASLIIYTARSSDIFA